MPAIPLSRSANPPLPPPPRSATAASILHPRRLDLHPLHPDPRAAEETGVWRRGVPPHRSTPPLPRSVAAASIPTSCASIHRHQGGERRRCLQGRELELERGKRADELGGARLVKWDGVGRGLGCRWGNEGEEILY
uniref:Uncharacterized protein n=1 Tax=Oryza nivara TaxID=4536 RepID=A0A0E0J570_ORYNI